MPEPLKLLFGVCNIALREFIWLGKGLDVRATGGLGQIGGGVATVPTAAKADALLVVPAPAAMAAATLPQYVETSGTVNFQECSCSSGRMPGQS